MQSHILPLRGVIPVSDVRGGSRAPVQGTRGLHPVHQALNEGGLLFLPSLVNNSKFLLDSAANPLSDREPVLLNAEGPEKTATRESVPRRQTCFAERIEEVVDSPRAVVPGAPGGASVQGASVEQDDHVLAPPVDDMCKELC